MTQVIYKYYLNIVDEQVIELPSKFQILSVADQGGVLCMWALVDTSTEPTEILVEVIGTGNPVSKSQREFVGTVLMAPFVWHVFIRNPKGTK